MTDSVTIHYVGLDNLGLSPIDTATLRSHIESSAAHLHHIHNCALRVHLTSHAHTDGKAQFSAHLFLTYDDKTINSDKHHSWDAMEAVEQAFESLQIQVDKHFPQHKGQKTPRRFDENPPL